MAQPGEQVEVPKKKHSTDPERRRATYGVSYPDKDMIFETRHAFSSLSKAKEGDERATIASHRLKFSLPYGVVDSILFRECNFHDQRGIGVSQISLITFRNCVFERCMIGAITFHRVRFEGCLFAHVGFENAEFIECSFENCTFKRCTTEHAFFTRTQLSAKAFMAGLECPTYNHNALAENSKLALEKDWKRVRARIARAIASGSDASSSLLADEALYVARLEDWKAQAAASRLKMIASLPKGATIWITNGGTSLAKSLGIVVGAVFAMPILLSLLGCTYREKTISVGTFAEFCTWTLRAVGLVLAYSPDGFAATGLGGELLLALSPALGVLWLAVVLAVFVRRIYR